MLMRESEYSKGMKLTSSGGDNGMYIYLTLFTLLYKT